MHLMMEGRVNAALHYLAPSCDCGMDQVLGTAILMPLLGQFLMYCKISIPGHSGSC